MTDKEYLCNENYKIINQHLAYIGLDEDIIGIIQDLIIRELKINMENSTNE